MKASSSNHMEKTEMQQEPHGKRSEREGAWPGAAGDPQTGLLQKLVNAPASDSSLGK